MGAGCHPHGQVAGSGKRPEAPNMVGVFVRDQHRVQGGDAHAKTLQAAFQFAQRKPAIDQQPGSGRFDQRRVAATSTAKRSETHRSPA